MKRHKLAVEKRKILGKKVHKLRRENILPANIYGKDIKSLSVQVPYKDFEKVYKEAGETGIVDIEVEGLIKPSLIRNIQQDYYNHKLLHVDFFQVNLKEKVKTTVPIQIVGEAKAVVDKLGLLLQPLSQIEIEALPEDLPENISVNVEHLDAVNAQVTVGNLNPPKGVAILTDSSQVVAKIGELISKEAAEQAAAEQAAAEAARATSDVAKAAAGPAIPTPEGAKPEGAEVPAQGSQPKASEEKPQTAKPQAQPATPKPEGKPQK